MLPSKFVEGFYGDLSKQWIATMLTPAFCFWSGGTLAFLSHLDRAQRVNIIQKLDIFSQLLILVVFLLIVVTSAFIVQHFNLAVLKFLEGYWPNWFWPFKYLRRVFIRDYTDQLTSLQDEWQSILSQSELYPRSLELLEKRASLEYKRRWIPSQAEYLMPTRLGNSIRASELRPSRKYGLDTIVCWPHLWLILPDNARKDLHEARANLNTAAEIWLWGILFVLCWTPLTILATPLGLTTAFFAYRWALSAARVYGDLVEASFDLYRTNLYAALRWPLPSDSSDEIEKGKMLSEYLWRGPVHHVIFQK